VFKFRYALITFFTIWIIVAIVSAMQLKGPEKFDWGIPEDFELMKAIKSLEENYNKGKNDDKLKVNIVYGVSGVD